MKKFTRWFLLSFPNSVWERNCLRNSVSNSRSQLEVRNKNKNRVFNTFYVPKLCLETRVLKLFRYKFNIISTRSTIVYKNLLFSFFHNIFDTIFYFLNILDELVTEAGSFYIMDRGYIDFNFLTNNFTLPALTVAQPYKSRLNLFD